MKRIGFSDYSLADIIIDYNNVVINIKDDDAFEIICKNFIGLDYIGQWDENIISDIEIYDSDIFIDQSKEVIAQNNDTEYKGGGVKVYNANWKCLHLKLIDGVIIKIACQEIEIVKKCDCNNL